MDKVVKALHDSYPNDAKVLGCCYTKPQQGLYVAAALGLKKQGLTVDAHAGRIWPLRVRT